MLQWLIVDIREVSDGGERTKEDGIGDGLVMCGGGKKAEGGGEKSSSTTTCQSRQITAETARGRREKKVRVASDPDGSLQHDCLAFSRGIRDDKDSMKISGLLFQEISFFNFPLESSFELL